MMPPLNAVTIVSGCCQMATYPRMQQTHIIYVRSRGRDGSAGDWRFVWLIPDVPATDIVRGVEKIELISTFQ